MACGYLVLAAGCATPETPPRSQSFEPSTKQSCDVLILSVNIVDVAIGEILEPKDVCIQSTTIVGISNTATARYVARTTIFAKGLYLIPGLNDMHVHFRGGTDALDENRDLLALYLAHGITRVYDLGGDISDELRLWREQIRTGTLDGPEIKFTGPKIDGPDPWFAGSLIVETRRDAEAAIETLAQLGVDGVKIMGGTLSNAAFNRVLDVANEQQVQSIGHIPITLSATRSAERGLRGIAHSRSIVFDGVPTKDDIRAKLDANEISESQALAAFASGFDRPTMHAALARLERTGVALISTYYGDWLMAGALADDRLEMERENYRYAGPYVRNSVEAGISRDRPFAEDHQRTFERLRAHLAWALTRIEGTDILLLAGTDSGPRNSIPGSPLHRELELLAQIGLSEAYVLRAATLNPSVFFGTQGRTGLVTVGRVADLVLLSSNPLEDISSTRNIEGVIKSGEYFSKADIKTKLSELERKYAN